MQNETTNQILSYPFYPQRGKKCFAHAGVSFFFHNLIFISFFLKNRTAPQHTSHRGSSRKVQRLNLKSLKLLKRIREQKSKEAVTKLPRERAFLPHSGHCCRLIGCKSAYLCERAGGYLPLLTAPTGAAVCRNGNMKELLIRSRFCIWKMKTSRLEAG